MYYLTLSLSKGEGISPTASSFAKLRRRLTVHPGMVSCITNSSR